ncbi:MAG: 50S ribosomal protein L9 [Proteobacteria bacterium]|nr:50S ribosomal protein L9 [Pseudomonadota bacterium]
MEVILLERIARLGAVGDVVKVRNGYGRNFLLPLKKALRATAENKKVFEERRHIIEEQNREAKEAAAKVAAKMEGLTLTLVRQASQEGKLYGSVTIRDIAGALKEQGFDVPNSQIVLSTIIKNTGEYPVRITLHAEVVTTVTLNVARVESEAA